MSKRSRKQTVKGTIISFNISPKGMYEGVLVKTENADIVQINFYPEFGAYIGDRLALEQKISWPVSSDEQEKHAAHTVYSLLRFPQKEGGDILLEDDGQDVTSNGTVTQINYALHGEPNGVVLDNGDFIHVKPKGFRDAELALGQKLKIRGELKPSVLNEHRVIEAHSINGADIKHKQKHKKAA